MKALRWYGKKDLRYEDIPEPYPGPGQVKVKINKIGICGSDLHDYSEGSEMIPVEKAPLIIGHEFTGIVTDIRQGARGFSKGDRVTGLGYWACHECYFCKRGQYNLCLNSAFTGMNVNGCMAEYMVAPDYTFYRIPDSVSDENAVLVEPLSVALHAVRLGRVTAGDTIAIVGEGTIGLSVLLTARATGASRIIMIAKHKNRGEVAKALGATEVLYIQDSDPVQSLKNLTGGLGADVCFECVGRQETAQLSVDLARRGGTIVMMGVFQGPGMFNFNSIGLNQKTIIGSPIYIDEAKAVLTYLADGRINPNRLISARVPFKDAIDKGFEYQLAHKEQNIKVILEIS
jgi:(R,R)-butanediol dehydrogenase / meso-butanediol dehydrogenase / diacetyl reductase